MTNYSKRYGKLIQSAAELWDDKDLHNRKEHFAALKEQEPEPDKIKSELDLLKSWLNK